MSANNQPLAEFKSAAVYFADSDCVEYVTAGGFCVYERVDGFLTLIKDSTGHNLIGFKLKGFRCMFERLRAPLALSDKHFLPIMSAFEAIYTEAGDKIFADNKRMSAYKAAYALAVNDNVQLQGADLLAA